MCERHHICDKDYIWNPTTCICENRKYLASIKGDSMIKCYEIIKETFPDNFNEKKQHVECQISIFYIHF